MLFTLLLLFLEQSNALKTVKDQLLSTPSVLPISIRSKKMKSEGDVSCTENNCPDIGRNINNYDPNSESHYNCGETCTATTGSLEYTFRGEKFGIYGVYSTSNGKFNVFLDDQKVTEVDSNRASTDKYSLLYLSNDLSYGNHTVKIQGQGNKRFQIYKLVFWPSLKAKRMNISELSKTGSWVYETDQIGGVRGYTEFGGDDETAIAPVRFSKLWVYGTVCQWHHPFNLDINSYHTSINPNNPELNTNDKRLEAELLYEVDVQPSENLKFTMVKVATLNFIYYIEEPKPSPTPSVLPISIRSAKMKKDGDAKCETNNCPIFDKVENYHPEADNTYECGEICTVKTGSLEYTFKGEKFGIYGVYDPNNGKLNVLVDGRNVAEIDSGKTKTINHHSVFYISNDLTYGDHTVKVQAQGNKDAQIYKLVFWPSLKAKRMNITEMTRTGNWKYESDKIGGLRAYTVTGDSIDETASASIRFSKLWVYGTICQWHGKFQLDIFSFNHEISSYDPALTNDDLRLDSALLYETPELAPSDRFKFTMTQTSTLNYVYYIEESAIPVPSVVPISIRSAKMKRTGDVSCGSNDCPNINNNVNNYNPDAENTYQCGETCSATTGSFEYSFIGEKFGIYSAYSLTNGKYDILLDGQKVKEIDLGKQGTSKYSLSYISDDLQYREHTVKIQGKDNKQIQLYKLVFWPSLKAKRLNVTQFQRTGTWKYETDLIGGVRAYTEVDKTNEDASTNLRFSKLWIYGTKCGWHGRFNAYFGDLVAEINEHDSSLSNDDLRQDSVLIFESPIVDSKQYNLRIELKESLTLNYVYYIEERMPIPTPSATPISIRFAKMTLSGDSSCGTNNCPNLNTNLENYHPEDENTYQCGETCTATTGSFEYSFTGVKFGIFGSYSSNNGAFDILVDGQKVNDVDTGLESNEKFSLLYLSENLSYHKHTVKIQAKGGKQIQLYKLVFWPSLNAKRLNISEFNRTGRWIFESDLCGGIRAYAEVDGQAFDFARAQVRFSKVWLYGTICSWHGKYKVEFGDFTSQLSEYGPSYNSDATRLDYELLFESPEITLNDFTFSVSGNESFTINCIYYVDEKPPAPTPSAIPISIPFNKMEKEGTIEYYKSNSCPTTNLDSPSTYNCATKSITSTGSFTYKFYGEKFGIIGALSPTFGKFTLEIDSQRKEINTYKDTYEEYANLYLSEDLQYKEHTVKVSGIGQKFQVYKLFYWPSIRAKRLNITDFELEGDWIEETDEVGGIRKYTVGGNQNETAVAHIHCSHFWVYGSKCSWHGKLHLTYGDLYEVLNEHISTDREDQVKLYESPDLNTDATEFKFTIMDTATLNYIYYIEAPYNPTPTPSTIPISIRLDQMNQEGDFICYTNTCPDSIPDQQAYPCGTKCTSNSGKYHYSFIGVKFALIGATGSNYDSFNLIIDDSTQPITIDTKTPNTNEFTILYLSEELSYQEHTVKIEGNSGLFKLYKLIYWPSLLAKRINITEFELKGDWKQESDLIGGVRAYSSEGGVNETATAQIRCSHLWVYGTKCSWHGNLYLNVGDSIHEEKINSKVNDPFPKRYDSALLYESGNFVFDRHNVQFIIADTATIYYVYYLELPPPSETPTPSYTPEPTPVKYIYYESDCTESSNNHRCFKENNDHDSIDIEVIVTSFTGLKNQENDGGSAIHLINTGLICDNSTFTDCTSVDAFGGAIYIKNNYLYELNYDLSNLTFNKCVAKCGGAIYLYCVSERSTIRIAKCKFNDNQALAPKTDEYFGGSGAFLTCINAEFIENSFYKNKGIGGALKLFEKFEEPDTGSLILSIFNKRTILVSRCTFQIENTSDCSLFYFGGRSDIKVELKDSIFEGNLASNSHHINGLVTSKDASKLDVKNCKFSHDFLKSIRIDKKNNYISINLKNQVFEGKKMNDINNKVSGTWKISCLAFSALAVAGLVFTLMRKNSNESDDVNDPLSLSDSNE